MPISSMTITQLADFFRKLDNDEFPSIIGHLMPYEVAYLIRVSGATHETLKYGIPINGLTPAQRCTLFTWLNKGKRLSDGEKLLFPILEIPNKAAWSEEQFDWFLFVGLGIERANGEPWTKFVDDIAVKIWEILDIVRGTDLASNSSIQHLIQLGSLKELQGYVSKCVQFSLKPLKTTGNMIQFMTKNNVIDSEDKVLIKKLEEAKVDIDKIRYGLYMPGFTFEERCTIFEKMTKVDVLMRTNILRCPSILWPVNLFHDKAMLNRYMALCGISINCDSNNSPQQNNNNNNKEAIDALAEMMVELCKEVRNTSNYDTCRQEFTFTYAFYDSDMKANVRKFALFSAGQGAEYKNFCA